MIWFKLKTCLLLEFLCDLQHRIAFRQHKMSWSLVAAAFTVLHVPGTCSHGALFFTACLTLALFHYHHSLLPDVGSTAQRHSNSLSFWWCTAGAGGPPVEGSCLRTQSFKLSFRRDKEGAALAETQLVVYCHCFASICCHMLGRWQRGSGLG